MGLRARHRLDKPGTLTFDRLRPLGNEQLGNNEGEVGQGGRGKYCPVVLGYCPVEHRRVATSVRYEDDFVLWADRPVFHRAELCVISTFSDEVEPARAG